MAKKFFTDESLATFVNETKTYTNNAIAELSSVVVYTSDSNENISVETDEVLTPEGGVTESVVNNKIAAAKNELIGTADDLATADTINGAKNYAKELEDNVLRLTNNDNLLSKSKVFVGKKYVGHEADVAYCSYQAVAVKNGVSYTIGAPFFTIAKKGEVIVTHTYPSPNNFEYTADFDGELYISSASNHLCPFVCETAKLTESTGLFSESALAQMLGSEKRSAVSQFLLTESLKPKFSLKNYAYGNLFNDPISVEEGIYYKYAEAGKVVYGTQSEIYSTVVLPVKPNTHYTSSAIRFLIRLKEPLILKNDTVYAINGAENVTSFDSEEANYVAISYKFKEIANPFLYETGTIAGGVTPSSVWYSPEWLKPVSPLFGKTIVNFGDSIAENRSDSESYAVQLKKQIRGTLKDYAVGGSTVSRVAGQTMGCILTQIETHIVNYSSEIPDVILIDGGANDFSQSRTVGEVIGNSNQYNENSYTVTFDETTFLGALEKSIQLLRSTYPSAIIVFIIPHKHMRLSATWEQMLTGIRECARKWSIALLDMDKDGQLNSRLSNMRIYTDEGGTHQNTLGNTKFYLPRLLRLLENYFI